MPKAGTVRTAPSKPSTTESPAAANTTLFEIRRALHKVANVHCEKARFSSSACFGRGHLQGSSRDDQQFLNECASLKGPASSTHRLPRCTELQATLNLCQIADRCEEPSEEHACKVVAGVTVFGACRSAAQASQAEPPRWPWRRMALRCSPAAVFRPVPPEQLHQRSAQLTLPSGALRVDSARRTDEESSARQER